MTKSLRDIYPKLICTKHELGHVAAHRIEAYLLEPTTDRWETIHRYALLRVPHYVSLWDAVCQVAPDFPRLGRVTDDLGMVWRDWQDIPAPDELVSALFWAAERSDVDTT